MGSGDAPLSRVAVWAKAEEEGCCETVTAPCQVAFTTGGLCTGALACKLFCCCLCRRLAGMGLTASCSSLDSSSLLMAVLLRALREARVTLLVDGSGASAGGCCSLWSLAFLPLGGAWLELGSTSPSAGAGAALLRPLRPEEGLGFAAGGLGLQLLHPRGAQRHLEQPSAVCVTAVAASTGASRVSAEV